MNFKTTTPEGTEGCNISYSEEKRFAENLLKELPEGWSVWVRWVQVMFFCDVNYDINFKDKIVEVTYNNSLGYWSQDLLGEIKMKIKNHDY